MPSWIEELAWAVRCPTCQAASEEPCRSVYDHRAPLEFNHPSRNRLFHVQQEVRRAASRRQSERRVPGGRSEGDGPVSRP